MKIRTLFRSSSFLPFESIPLKFRYFLSSAAVTLSVSPCTMSSSTYSTSSYSVVLDLGIFFLDFFSSATNYYSSELMSIYFLTFFLAPFLLTFDFLGTSLISSDSSIISSFFACTSSTRPSSYFLAAKWFLSASTVSISRSITSLKPSIALVSGRRRSALSTG
jgi:hypothetical protein